MSPIPNHGDRVSRMSEAPLSQERASPLKVVNPHAQRVLTYNYTQERNSVAKDIEGDRFDRIE